MHLAVWGAIGNFTCSWTEKRLASNLSAQFHQDIKLWRNLCTKMTDRPTYLVELFHQPASDLGYTYISVLDARGV